MAFLVVSGGLAMCTNGTGPAQLVATSAPGETVGGQPAATIMDYQPMTNIPSFGVCTSMANPQVAAASEGAAGVATPQPCIPSILGPWVLGSTRKTFGGYPALVMTDTCHCAWGGEITIAEPGQTSESDDG